MRTRGLFSPIRWVSVGLLLISLVLTILQLVRFSRVRSYFPSGLKIAGVPVGGLDRQGAAERLSSAYNLPVEVYYNNAPIQLEPKVVDFELDLDSMLAAADLLRTEKIFWVDFWDYLWGRGDTPVEIPLVADFSEERLRVFLKENVAERYDQAPVAASPVVGTVNFQPGRPGTDLDIDGSVLLIENALSSLTQRRVALPLERTNPSRPAFANVEVLLRQTIELSGFDGLVGIFLLDLQSAQELHFAYRQGEDINVKPDVAFTASSIIKIPIMVSAYRRMVGNRDAESMRLLQLMIDKSGNEASDSLMNRLIEGNRAPLAVTEDLHSLGLLNTFLGGYFYTGAPLLQKIETPANTRAEINTDPDPYSQTTPSDIGMLLEDIYQCATTGGGALTAVFPGEITQDECQSMISLLTQNEIGVLIKAGVPDGTQVAHKHGWVTSPNGVINAIGDAGIVYTPGGNLVFVVFLHHPDQLVWDPASRLIAELSRAVYNYYNLPIQ